LAAATRIVFARTLDVALPQLCPACRAADVVAKASGLKVAHRALKRVKPTPQQVGLARAERAVNVQGAFRLRHAGQSEVKGRRLILVDDVLTSGATLEACARTLLRAGAAQVDVLVFARVVAPARIPI
jgi:predicted amidophosphoribosyltransferase